MNSKQNAKLNMAQRVSETFKRYETQYDEISPMVEAVTALNEIIASIRGTQKEHKAVNLSASSLEKLEAERQMIESCVKMANAMYVIGFTTQNKDLMTLQGLNEYHFSQQSNNAALALACRILDLTHGNVVKLKTYGIEDTEITAMEKAIEAFHILIAKPMDTIGERKQKTINLTQLFKELDSVFFDKLNKLMVLFKQKAPEFYSEYRTAHNIIFTSEKKKEIAR
jgi:hypothetical protein